MIEIQSLPLDGETWSVRLRIFGQYVEVSGKASRFVLHLTKVTDGYLASIPNLWRSGYVDGPNTDPVDLKYQLGIQYMVDATTIATAIRYLAGQGVVPEHPEFRLVENETVTEQYPKPGPRYYRRGEMVMALVQDPDLYFLSCESPSRSHDPSKAGWEEITEEEAHRILGCN